MGIRWDSSDQVLRFVKWKWKWYSRLLWGCLVVVRDSVFKLSYNPMKYSILFYLFWYSVLVVSLKRCKWLKQEIHAMQEEGLENFKPEGSVEEFSLLGILIFKVNWCDISFLGSLEMALLIKNWLLINY